MPMRKICVVTGTRAEYGLLYWLLRELQQSPDVELQLAVTGTHLSHEHGYTVQQIEQDGFEIADRVDMQLTSDSAVAISHSMGLAISGFGELFERLAPDLLVVLGDRYEILAAAQAAMLTRIPIAHIHGGETTEGAIDEAIRHALSKMSHLHFVAAEPYRQRVIQMGEQPQRVFTVGAPVLDNLAHLEWLSLDELEQALEFKLGHSFFVVTYHPVTLASQGPEEAVDALLQALDAFPEAQLLFTGVNADPGHRVVAARIAAYVADNPMRAFAVDSLGQQRYLSALLHADLVIGNSSSGILEAPSMRLPTVNIGPRQRGRLRAPSVIDCAEETSAIVAAIEKALSEPFLELAHKGESPFGMPGAAKRIAGIISSYPLEGILFKQFHDIPIEGWDE